jgi:hypothetical protein
MLKYGRMERKRWKLGAYLSGSKRGFWSDEPGESSTVTQNTAFQMSDLIQVSYFCSVIQCTSLYIHDA